VVVQADELATYRAEVVQFFTSQPLDTIRPLAPAEFEKDDDSNHHIDFITAAANLRAREYALPEAPRLEVKRIAGRIVPAIATTTSAVSGLVSLELIKILNNAPLEQFKCAFLNLALPQFAIAEPAEARMLQCGAQTWCEGTRVLMMIRCIDVARSVGV
jgi:hypothetical protein